MNVKITSRFIITIVVVNILIFFINIIVGFSIMIKNEAYGFNFLKPITYENKKIDPETFTRKFGENIYIKNGKIEINEQGKKVLDENELWIQVLNENGNEVLNYRKPSEVQNKYTPIEIINTYKYIGGAEGVNSILASSVEVNGQQLSYIINFDYYKLNKSIILYDGDVLVKILRAILSAVLIMDSIIAILAGYLFSRKLTKPVKNIIGGVTTLSKNDYNLEFRERGLYKDVYANLNNLSRTLKNNERERKKLEKMREEWIANISHDIKTPLASIRGYAELMNGDYDFTVDEAKEYGEIIYDKSLYITELVNDLNLSTRLKNNALNLNKKKVNLVSLTKDVVIAILNDQKYSDRDIEFNTNVEVDEKEVDIILMKRCLTNLIFNAIAHNNEDVEIKVNFEKKNDKTYITIEDNGRGINEEDLKHIFDRYYRGTNTGEAHKGSGLGTAISKEIVKNHGGDIEIESKLNEGTKITIIL